MHGDDYFVVCSSIPLDVYIDLYFFAVCGSIYPLVLVVKDDYQQYAYHHGQGVLHVRTLMRASSAKNAYRQSSTLPIRDAPSESPRNADVDSTSFARRYAKRFASMGLHMRPYQRPPGKRIVPES